MEDTGMLFKISSSQSEHREENLFVKRLPEFADACDNTKWSTDGMLAVASLSLVHVFIPIYHKHNCYSTKLLQISQTAELYRKVIRPHLVHPM